MTTHELHIAMKLVRNRFYPAKINEHRARMTRRGVETRYEFGGDERSAGRVGGDFGKGPQQIVLRLSEDALRLIRRSLGQYYPVARAGRAAHRPFDAIDESEQDEKDHHQQRDAHRGHRGGGPSNCQAARVVAERDQLSAPPMAAESNREPCFPPAPPLTASDPWF